MKTLALLVLISSFLILSDREHDQIFNSTQNWYTATYFSELGGGLDIDASPADRLYLRDHSFSNFKLSVNKYFIPENDLGIDNTGVVLYYLEDDKSERQAGSNYTRGISFVSACLGALSVQFSYNAEGRNIELKADVADANGAVDHLLDCSFNINPCTAEPIASLLAQIGYVFGGGEC